MTPADTSLILDLAKILGPSGVVAVSVAYIFHIFVVPRMRKKKWANGGGKDRREPNPVEEKLEALRLQLDKGYKQGVNERKEIKSEISNLAERISRVEGWLEGHGHLEGR